MEKHGLMKFLDVEVVSLTTPELLKKEKHKTKKKKTRKKNKKTVWFTQLSIKSAERITNCCSITNIIKETK